MFCATLEQIELSTVQLNELLLVEAGEHAMLSESLQRLVTALESRKAQVREAKMLELRQQQAKVVMVIGKTRMMATLRSSIPLQSNLMHIHHHVCV